jgi:hypothetical protein
MWLKKQRDKFIDYIYRTKTVLGGQIGSRKPLIKTGFPTFRR